MQAYEATRLNQLEKDNACLNKYSEAQLEKAML